MPLNTTRNQVIALAGLTQAVYQVKKIATTGMAEQTPFESSISSILKIDAKNVEDIYGGLPGISSGLNQLQRQLTGAEPPDSEQGRYAAAIIFLEKQLSKNTPMLSDIRAGIELSQTQAEALGPTHNTVLTSLGDLYHTTVSTLNPRILVNGEQNHLSNIENIHKIRSLLLAGIRSALLWRQCGGRRWKFLLCRGKIQDGVGLLLNELRQQQ
ncbi:MAG: high frequency lysogenization protein HflD [Methylococcaceae bacterium]|jgi:high frequency lysogenization protein|nr:high frequency lysogenization protein HflD [Methylococcaceae bacterium]